MLAGGLRKPKGREAWKGALRREPGGGREEERVRIAYWTLQTYIYSCSLRRPRARHPSCEYGSTVSDVGSTTFYHGMACEWPGDKLWGFCGANCDGVPASEGPLMLIDQP